jgi:hypothetical protein
LLAPNPIVHGPLDFEQSRDGVWLLQKYDDMTFWVTVKTLDFEVANKLAGYVHTDPADLDQMSPSRTGKFSGTT